MNLHRYVSEPRRANYLCFPFLMSDHPLCQPLSTIGTSIKYHVPVPLPPPLPMTMAPTAHADPPIEFNFAPHVDQPLVVSMPPASSLPFFLNVNLPGPEIPSSEIPSSPSSLRSTTSMTPNHHSSPKSTSIYRHRHSHEPPSTPGLAPRSIRIPARNRQPFPPSGVVPKMRQEIPLSQARKKRAVDTVGGAVRGSGEMSDERARIRKPLNAFLIFRNECHDQVQAENPGLLTTQLSSIIGKLWRQLPDDVRSAYFAKAEHLKHMSQSGYQYGDFVRRPGENTEHRTSARTPSARCSRKRSKLTMTVDEAGVAYV
ncbi:hypothetical protein M427DRAFT_233707 [Gonapodya prolifera JEL478]|uniref:HMG box domain-containing protein n=1 Tax=Gonapodya prolifera (strain JEL478) TaxID=1344416 RepID=A0A138ZY05_GONPJ|nr:hypothetical protein M427DRAFT_233707 [Gonapodya prolifera JEL478]|eukprot:KXS09382.1 hypothetical protein M427DRAFT_233707 [Gonapodya prolifera JEL478]